MNSNRDACSVQANNSKLTEQTEQSQCRWQHCNEGREKRIERLTFSTARSLRNFPRIRFYFLRWLANIKPQVRHTHTHTHTQPSSPKESECAHNEKSLCGTKSYYDYFIIKSNLLLLWKGGWIESGNVFACNLFFFVAVALVIFISSTGSFPHICVPIRRLDWVNEWKVLDRTLTISNTYLAALCRYKCLVFVRDFGYSSLIRCYSHFFPSFRLHEGWVNLKTGIYAVRLNCLLHIHTHTDTHARSAKVPLTHNNSSSSTITLIRNQRRKVFCSYVRLAPFANERISIP